MAATAVRAVLIDLSGVLFVGYHPVAGAADALTKLYQAGIGIRFLTNTTRSTRAELVVKLTRLGFAISAEQIVTASSAARHFIADRGLRPHLLIHHNLLPEFDDYRNLSNPNAVLVGDAGDGFSYANLNTAFQVLMAANAPTLVAMGDNRYFRDGDRLALDMGPFVAALEYASGIKAVITGKPAAAFFGAALAKLNADPAVAVMVGDDLESDIGGAQRAGLRACLVRTGKYRAADERHPRIKPDQTVDDFPAAVDWILAQV